ncbi:MAG TPA: hypothetical protein VIG42_10255 [Solirubrobacteraceae bacterium]|jgi:hypothetical protein
MAVTPNTTLKLVPRRLLGALALILVGTVAVGESDAWSAGARASFARSARHRCVPVKSEVIARHGASLLFIHRTGPSDYKYGAPHALYGCRSAHQAPTLLFDFEDGDRPEIVIAAFNGSYAAFFLGWQSSTCSFYESAGAIDCSQSLFESVNLGGARGGVSVTNEDPNFTEPPSALVVTHAGWIAWAARLSRTSQPLLARDSRGERTLDAGPIDARSLRVSGKNVRWSDAGVAHSAVLG